MVSALDSVFELSRQLMKNSRHVNINHQGADWLAQEMKGLEFKPWGLPLCIGSSHSESERKKLLIAYELIASSVNYCYWSGRHDVRINDCSSTKMYGLLDECFQGDFFINNTIKNFQNKLLSHRFPLVEARIRHLEEIKDRFFPLLEAVLSLESGKISLEKCLSRLAMIPGFGQDPFLKRAVLFFGLLYRRMNWFASEIHLLPIPADYQVPKVLHHLGVLQYSNKLEETIYEHEPIASGSLMEMEIRAASILACQLIAEKSGKKMCDVDDYLWGLRKITTDPFHLTMTTDY